VLDTFSSPVNQKRMGERHRTRIILWSTLLIEHFLRLVDPVALASVASDNDEMLRFTFYAIIKNFQPHY
jgi:hypothetical protein